MVVFRALVGPCLPVACAGSGVRFSAGLRSVVGGLVFGTVLVVLLRRLP